MLHHTLRHRSLQLIHDRVFDAPLLLSPPVVAGLPAALFRDIDPAHLLAVRRLRRTGTRHSPFYLANLRAGSCYYRLFMSVQTLSASGGVNGWD